MGSGGRDARLIARAALVRGSRAALDFLLPACCAACSRPLDAHEQGAVCGRCWARLTPLPAPRCARCGHPTAHRECRWCALLPAYVRAVRSACSEQRGSARSIVHALKYAGWTRIAREMADRMAALDWPLDVVEERAFVIPVPLAPSRLRERGFNQSELLARALAGRWGIEARDDCLERARETTSQTRLTPGERLANVSGAFRATAIAREVLRGAHVLLVDDVVTTAATLNACAAALHAGGARILSYVTFGRAPAAGDR